MSKPEFHYSVTSDLPGGVESPGALGAKFLQTLDALSNIDPTIFTNWQVMDFLASRPLPLAGARPHIGTIIERNVTRDDAGDPEPYYGYTASAYSKVTPPSRRVSIRIKAGGKHKGETWLTTGQWRVFPDPTIVTYARFKSALLAINAIWPPPWACARAFRVDYHEVPLFPGAALFPYSRFHIPWIAYLSAQLATAVTLSGEIETERTPDGGLLMNATKDRLDPTNPEHLHRARILAETLIARTGYSSA